MRARRLCEKLLSYASPLGLYGEELDPDTGRHLGNFPQAFTHLSLINAVMHVIHAERDHAHRCGRGAPLAEGHRRTTAPRAGGNGKVAEPSRAPASRA